MSAIISDCGRYRYRLERELSSDGIVMAFFGVNPSTASAEIEDQTTMKWRGFAIRNGGRKYIAGNPFAFRATNVDELSRASDPVGAENQSHLIDIMRDADVLVPCWGSRWKLPSQLRSQLDLLAQMLRLSGKPIRIFGLTKSRDPKHPLMLGYDTPLVEWPAPNTEG